MRIQVINACYHTHKGNFPSCKREERKKKERRTRLSSHNGEGKKSRRRERERREGGDGKCDELRQRLAQDVEFLFVM